jgi:Mce-associated membrane protein
MEAVMVTPDDRRSVALATRRSRMARQLTRRSRTARQMARRRVGLDFLPGPEPLDVEEPLRVDQRPARPSPHPARKPRPYPVRKPRLPAPNRESGGRLRLAARLLVVALLGTAIAAGVFGRQWYDQRQDQAARQQALAAARQETVDFVSISAASVDRDLNRIAAGATGDFRDEFTRNMSQVRAAVMANKVDSRGTVLRAALVSSDRRGATVLVAVDATVKNTNAPAGRLSHYRIQVNLVRDAQSGRWLVSQLQFVG